MKYRTKLRHGESWNMQGINSDYENNPVSRTAAEIVIHAITDWRELVKQKAWRDYPSRNCNFEELRKFFKSDWCAFLMQGFDVEPARLLEVLEAELQEAMRKE